MRPGSGSLPSEDLDVALGEAAGDDAAPVAQRPLLVPGVVETDRVERGASDRSPSTSSAFARASRWSSRLRRRPAGSPPTRPRRRGRRSVSESRARSEGEGTPWRATSLPRSGRSSRGRRRGPRAPGPALARSRAARREQAPDACPGPEARRWQRRPGNRQVPEGETETVAWTPACRWLPRRDAGNPRRLPRPARSAVRRGRRSSSTHARSIPGWPGASAEPPRRPVGWNPWRNYQAGASFIGDG